MEMDESLPEGTGELSVPEPVEEDAPRRRTRRRRRSDDATRPAAGDKTRAKAGSRRRDGDAGATDARRRPRREGTRAKNRLRDADRSREAGEPRRRSHPSQTRRAVDRWWERLFEVADRRSFSRGASEYAANQTTRDYVLNTIGLGAWGMLFPLLSIIATQLAGTESAGMFSMAFTTATLVLYVGNYGVRTYQVSDIDEADSFASYQVHRLITCAVMLLICALWCGLKGYGREMTLIFWGAFGFRCVDALADTYEARLQQMGKLYLAGISVAVRSVAGIIAFALMLIVMKSLVVASIAMAVVALATFAVVTLPLAFLETPKSRAFDPEELKELFVECFPSFAALFLFGLIEAMPKFAMEGVLPYEDQVYFNAIYFPAQAILMVVGFVYKPQLVNIANVWADRGKRARFDLIVAAMLGVCAAVTVIMLAVFAWVGVWLNGLMYGVDFEPYRTSQYLMILAGGLSAGIDFLYQTITVLRRQGQATLIYLIAFLVVALASVVLVNMMGFAGAVYSYLIVMVVLFVMLATLFLMIRLRPAR